SRFVRELRASLSTGPAPTRMIVKPAVQLQLEPGRIAMIVEAELSEFSGELQHLEAGLPAGFRVVEATGPGLVDWTTTPDHRLHLMFDRRGPRVRRLLRIVGWIPLAEDPLIGGARPHRIRVPWFTWADADEGPGLLTITATSRPELQGSTGLAAVPPES